VFAGVAPFGWWAVPAVFLTMVISWSARHCRQRASW